MEKEVEEATERIKGKVRRTRVIRANAEELGIHGIAGVWMKCENEQETGSFKLRGATNAIIERIETEERGTGGRGVHVVTSSAGNHGLGVAVAARRVGARATVVVPRGAPSNKVSAIREAGAEVVISGSALYDDAERQARVIAAGGGSSGGSEFVSPYNDPRVIAGQGTAAVEFLQDAPPLDALIVPVGGGGLLSGVATVAKSFGGGGGGRRLKVFGAQSEACTVMRDSLAAGRIVAMSKEQEASAESTVAEGVHGGLEEPSFTFPIIEKLVDGVFVVSERSIRKSISDIARVHKMVVEGSAAVSVAALAENQSLFAGKRVGIILTGSNIDWSLFRRIVLEFP